MLSCDCCHCTVQRNDPEAITLTYLRRTIVLCRECNRVLIAILADTKLSPPLRIIQLRTRAPRPLLQGVASGQALPRGPACRSAGPCATSRPIRVTILGAVASCYKCATLYFYVEHHRHAQNRIDPRSR